MCLPFGCELDLMCVCVSVCVCRRVCMSHLPRSFEQCREEVSRYHGDIKMCGAAGHVV